MFLLAAAAAAECDDPAALAVDRSMPGASRKVLPFVVAVGEKASKVRYLLSSRLH